MTYRSPNTEGAGEGGVWCRKTGQWALTEPVCREQQRWGSVGIICFFHVERDTHEAQGPVYFL